MIRVTVLGFWLVFSVVTVAGICNSVGGGVVDFWPSSC